MTPKIILVTGVVIVIISVVFGIVCEVHEETITGDHSTLIRTVGALIVYGTILCMIGLFGLVIQNENNKTYSAYELAVKKEYAVYKNGNPVQDPEALKIDKNNFSKYSIKIDDKKKEIYVND